MPLQASAKARTRSVSNPSTSRKLSQPPTPVSTVFAGVSAAHSHREGLPAWDRTLDAVYHGAFEKGSFETVLGAFYEDHARKKPSSGYFRLPDSVRYRICQYLHPQCDKPMRLNKHALSRDAWRKEDFEAPSSTLLQLASYFEVSFAFRADVLVAFLQDTKLHTVLSPFTGPRISPLATTWLNNYGMYASNIVIELDMTHLGCGPDPGAVALLPNTEQIEKLLQDFVKAQMKRKESCPMESLVLLCRRFHGKRPKVLAELSRAIRSRPGSRSASRSVSRSAKTPEPYSPAATTPRRYNFEGEVRGLRSPASPELVSPTHPSASLVEEYCPDSYLLFCNNILRLKGRIGSVRMCGFSEEYTAPFMGTLFSNNSKVTKSYAYRVAPSTIWPKLSGQKSYVDMGDGNLSLDDHQVTPANDIPSAFRIWEGCVQLPPPQIDTNGDTLLPAIVGDLQRLRSAYARSTTSLSERTCEDMRKEGRRGDTLDKKTIAWFKSNYGKGKLKKKKRVLSRDAATTY
ncbi:alpha beta hydrolase fold [Fusarium beomiforme]|uniref:Alpha beta hydrolase fold n=1 Tax=Fusarium beomiforme TaxID=44412 RepID=A0A9P5DUR2_9HYPO|nr:alpha beta hydrolase fold [Fusarium beomiforme]